MRMPAAALPGPVASRRALVQALGSVTGVALLALGGCATRPAAVPAPGADAGTSPPPPARRYSGRLALRVDATPPHTAPQSLSGSFELQGDVSRGELRLFSPLGSTAALLRWSPAGAELQADGQTTRHASLDALAQAVTGTTLPMAALFDWLDGKATEAAGWRADLSLHNLGRVRALRESPEPAAELRVILDQP